MNEELKLYFSEEEKLNFLKKKGFVIKEETEIRYEKEYHNQIVEIKDSVYAIYKNGESYFRPYIVYSKCHWLDLVFYDEIKKAFLEKL